MKRVLRWIWNGATVVSLLLCMVTMVLWIRSYWNTDWITWQTPVGNTEARYYSVGSSFGRARFTWYTARFPAVKRGEYIRSFNAGMATSALKSETGQSFPLNEATRRSMRWFGYFHKIDSEADPDPAAGLYRRYWVPQYDARYLTLPLPLLALTALCLPLARLIRHIRKRSYRPGLCPACGYDLRASPDRCPECGKANPAAVLESRP